MRGLILQAKYCFMPNKIGACGDLTKTGDLFEYAAGNFEDRGLEEILKSFEAAYPYLKFIAEANNIHDPFDERVVEAYWIGNGLLEKVNKLDFYNWCFDRYGKKVDKKALQVLVGKVPMGALPHHSFHVFNAFFREKDYQKVLYFVNECRISTAKVVKVGEGKAQVEYLPIELTLKGLSFGKKEKRDVLFQLSNKGFVQDLKPGDLVTVHWGWICEKIDNKKMNYLDKNTQTQLALFNHL